MRKPEVAGDEVDFLRYRAEAAEKLVDGVQRLVPVGQRRQDPQRHLRRVPVQEPVSALDVAVVRDDHVRAHADSLLGGHLDRSFQGLDLPRRQGSRPEPDVLHLRQFLGCGAEDREVDAAQARLRARGEDPGAVLTVGGDAHAVSLLPGHGDERRELGVQGRFPSREVNLLEAQGVTQSRVAPSAVAATTFNVRPEAVGSRRLSPSRVTIDVAMDPARTPPSLT